jgi:DNA-binding NarL/FixJ family response regulator
MLAKILLVDDHVVVRKGLRAILEKDLPECTIIEASDGVRAVDLARREEPELIVIDIGMPGLNGLEAIRQIIRRSPRIRILVLSLHDEEPIVRRSFEYGASGYLLKECAVDELVGAVKAVFLGKRYLSAGLPDSVRDAVRRKKKNAPVSDPLESLTHREREILGLLAAGHKNSAIAEELFISPETVKTHRKNLMRKLDLHNISSLVKLALEHHLVPQP